jgi:2-oxoglutarate dehydrogenase E1 component
MDKYNHLNQSNLPYIESLFEDFRRDPDSVEMEWRKFFEGVEFAKKLGASSTLGVKELNIYNLIKAYRDYGHFEADLDPLGFDRPKCEMLSLKYHDFEEADLEQVFDLGSMVDMQGKTLKEIVAHVRELYCGTFTVQIASSLPEEREWFINQVENCKKDYAINAEQKKRIHQEIVATEALEKFFHTRYVGQKRFSVEGADSLITMLEELVIEGTAHGLKDVVIGMAHRGRINVLANFMNKALDLIFAEFDGHHMDIDNVDGDVKYHLGFSVDKETPSGPCHISLAFNPSHLEAVAPVACGMVRAKQRINEDSEERKTVLPILIHGDASFAGQGVVPETLQLSKLKGYEVGGSLHIIIDNQVGFTAAPEFSRSSPYASDMAKGLLIPVIHVNGDDPEACVKGILMAAKYRREFKSDVVVNMICYRRHGHNEGDEPAFTQPLMYKIIKKHPTLFNVYSQKLIKESVMTEAETDAAFDKETDRLQGVLDAVRESPPEIKPIAFAGVWSGLRLSNRDDFEEIVDTSVSLEVLKEAGGKMLGIPSDFKIHSKLKRLLESRGKMLSGDELLDWGMCELLSYASLLHEGTHVRLTGQDSVRGTFSHRHSCLYDQETGEQLNLLSQINPEKNFCVYDSSLSEYAVLGFEYGNSSSDPRYLSIWEAQFGDFSNGAQIMIDQFIVSAETKWFRMSGLVMFLPHGYEGQGPEHSSARLERFLQLCAQDNIQVCNLTTPAQMFHVLRRQMLREFRKPLIIMTPKSLLRHPKVKNSLEDLTSSHFKEIIDDPQVEDPEVVKHLILCSGKLYYDLDDHYDAKNLSCPDRAIIRIEQIYPFVESRMSEILERYPNTETIVWAQEEPRNMGAWMFIAHKLRGYLHSLGKNIPLIYAGRTARASSATGSPQVHKEEQLEIIEKCYSNDFIAIEKVIIS